MTKPMIRIFDALTGETIDREMDDGELKQYHKDQKESQERQKELEQKATAKAALLERLGITEEEARLLLG